MILVPAFLYILKMISVEARATSLTCILPMVIASSFFYAKNDYLNWNFGTMCAIGGIIGSFIGSKILNKISENVLKITFIVFLVYAASKLIGLW